MPDIKFRIPPGVDEGEVEETAEWLHAELYRRLVNGDCDHEDGILFLRERLEETRSHPHWIFRGAGRVLRAAMAALEAQGRLKVTRCEEGKRLLPLDCGRPIEDPIPSDHTCEIREKFAELSEAQQLIVLVLIMAVGNEERLSAQTIADNTLSIGEANRGRGKRIADSTVMKFCSSKNARQWHIDGGRGKGGYRIPEPHRSEYRTALV